MINLSKVILGISLASFATTLVLVVWAATSVGFTQHPTGAQPEDVIPFTPVVFVVVFVIGGLPFAFLAQLLRITKQSASKSCVLAGGITGVTWSVIINFSKAYKMFFAFPTMFLSFPILCLLGIMAGRIYWFVVYRNTEQTAILDGKS